MLKQNLSFNQTYTLKDPDHDEIKDGYQLRWVGKNYAKLQENLLPETVIVPDSTHNSQDPNKDSQNLFLTGDNLEVLKHLEHAYTGKVDMIYIDPPYNTGSDGFVYNDDFGFTDDQLRDTLGLTDEEVKRIKNLYGKSSHSAWLTFMYPRLKIAKKLLKDTGVIFVSIDDNEQANLKLLMDEVFYEANFITTFIWEKTQHFGRQKVNYYNNADYVLCYGSRLNDSGKLREILIERIKTELEDAPLYNASNNIQTLTFPAGKVKFNIGDGRYSHSTDEKYELLNEVNVVNQKNANEFKLKFRSRWSAENVTEELDRGTTFWVKSSNFAIRAIYTDGRESMDSPKQIFFTNNNNEYVTTTENGKKIGTNEDASSQIFDLFGSQVFSYPKPSSLIEYLVSLYKDKSSLILDFFAGSGTTAHAVMDLNKDGGNRRYIMCTLDEPVKPGSEAEKAGYKTIDEIGRERIKRAAKEIGDKSGFRHYRFVKPGVTTLDKIETFDPKVSQLIPEDMIAPFSEQALTGHGGNNGVQTILTTRLIDDGYDFSTSPQTLDLAGYTAYYAPSIARLYLIEKDGWTSESCKALLNKLGKNEISVNAIVVYSYSFGFTELTELRNNLKANLDGKPELIERY